MIKFVSADDWVVIYGSTGKKIWEGNHTDNNSIIALVEYFGFNIDFYEFTDENEIDGETPVNFYDIIGIKKYEE